MDLGFEGHALIPDTDADPLARSRTSDLIERPVIPGRLKFTAGRTYLRPREGEYDAR
jgi:hypothetical protein